MNGKTAPKQLIPKELRIQELYKIVAASEHGLKASEVAARVGLSRGYTASLLRELVDRGMLASMSDASHSPLGVVWYFLHRAPDLQDT